MTHATRALNALTFNLAALSRFGMLNKRIRNNKRAADNRSRFVGRRCAALRFALIASLFVAVAAVVAIPLGAQTAAKPVNPRPWMQAYDPAHEISIEGTVQEVVSHRIPGSPIGLHVIVSAAQGPLDVHLGPYMSKATVESLKSGTPIGIIGAMMQVNGRDYLLARQINFNGQSVTVRAESGVLVRTVNRTWQASSESANNGGAQ